MNDGAIVVGALDMSEALAGASASVEAPARTPAGEEGEPGRPRLMWVEPPDEESPRDGLS